MILGQKKPGALLNANLLYKGNYLFTWKEVIYQRQFPSWASSIDDRKYKNVEIQKSF